MAVPEGFDSFFSFPHAKDGYSGVCTYSKIDYAVPIKAEEGITGIFLGLQTNVGGSGPGGSSKSTSASAAGTGSTGSKLIYRAEEKIGYYPDEDDVHLDDEVNGQSFDLKRLDMEGRAIVLDFGLFVIFNLYCPNETNDARRPYKMNYMRYLQARVDRLVRQGRNVIVVGDMNIIHLPIDSGEGGSQRAAEEHFQHPARKWFDDWIAPKGPMTDTTRTFWPGRKGMYTCESESRTSGRMTFAN